MRNPARSSFVCALSLAASLFGIRARAGSLNDVAFTDYSPLSSNTELARRLMRPLEAAQLPDLVARAGKTLKEQPVDLSQERFVLYVPAAKPPGGYGLLVFVSSSNAAKVPPDWAGILDQYGVIFVAAENSGNDASVIGRREPLAILAEQNVVRRYAVDPRRIYVAGFSGGSRVAMRLALGYPDIFRGALLNAGSDPIGTAANPLPPKELFAQFQSASHLVYVTGENDTFIHQTDQASIHAMRDWCVRNVDRHDVRAAAHQVADASSLAWALDALDKQAEPDQIALAACRSAIDADLTRELQEAQSDAAAGKKNDAKDILERIDVRFGGLAAPKSVELWWSLAN
jgi:dienelactone hydrolase